MHTQKGEKVLLKLAEKARLLPAEADALDFKRYNLKHLKYGSRAASFESFERRHNKVPVKLVYADGIVFAVESFVESVAFKRRFRSVLDLGDRLPIPCYTLRDGVGGGREPTLMFIPGFQLDAEEGTRPLGVVTFGISRTLPELLEDSTHYFDHPSSDIKLCLGIKIYVPTKQMIAFLRLKDGISWVLSFGIESPETSTLAVLGNHDLTDRAAGVGMGDEPCSRPGMPAYMRKLDLELFQVEIDFFLIQQACLMSFLSNLCIHFLNHHEILSIRKRRADAASSSGSVKRMKLSIDAAESSKCPNCQKSARLMPVCERELNDLPKASHFGNKVEQQITMTYIQNSRLSLQDVLGYWCSETTASAPVCDACAETVIVEAMDTFRMSVPKDEINFKPDCWYGYRCRTQHHEQSHAEKLNHMCHGQKLETSQSNGC